MSITTKHMASNLERWNVGQVKAAGTCFWACAGHCCRWINRSSEVWLPDKLTPNPSPRHRHFLPQGGHRTAACPSAKTGLVSADHTPGVSVPWIYTVVWCNVKRTLPHAMGQQCSNLVKAWMVSKLKETHHCHFISLVPGTSNNSSSHSVLTSTLGGWHTSQLVLRRKDYAVWSSEQGLIWQELNWVLLSLESSVLVSSP